MDAKSFLVYFQVGQELIPIVEMGIDEIKSLAEDLIDDDTRLAKVKTRLDTLLSHEQDILNGNQQ